MDVKEKGGQGVAAKEEVKKEERKCPACGKPWTKTNPTLGEVRRAIQEELSKFRDPLHQLARDAELGYRGSVARGTVGNPNKPHYNHEPDIRGECGVGYDVDGCVFSDTLTKVVPIGSGGKRWGRGYKPTRKLETDMRSALQGRPELAHMKTGKDAFEIVVREWAKKQEVIDKGGYLAVIPPAVPPGKG